MKLWSYGCLEKGLFLNSLPDGGTTRGRRPLNVTGDDLSAVDEGIGGGGSVISITGRGALTPRGLSHGRCTLL